MKLRIDCGMVKAVHDDIHILGEQKTSDRRMWREKKRKIKHAKYCWCGADNVRMRDARKDMYVDEPHGATIVWEGWYGWYDVVARHLASIDPLIIQNKYWRKKSQFGKNCWRRRVGREKRVTGPDGSKHNACVCVCESVFGIYSTITTLYVLTYIQTLGFWYRQIYEFGTVFGAVHVMRVHEIHNLPFCLAHSPIIQKRQKTPQKIITELIDVIRCIYPMYIYVLTNWIPKRVRVCVCL